MFILSSPLAFLATVALAIAPLLPSATAFDVTAASATAPGVIAPSVTADESAVWSVHPASAEGPDERETFSYQVDPGTEIRDFVAIINSGPVAATFAVYATDAINDFETGGYSLLPADQPPVDVGAAIALDLSEITLEPGTQAVVPFRVTVATDVTPGDHAAGIVASVTKAGDGTSGQAVSLDQRVGARVILNVSGAPTVSVETAGMVTRFDSPWNPFAGGTLHLDYAVKNTGNLRVDVEQAATVTGPFGIGLGTMAPAALTTVLPGQSVHVTAELANVPPLFAVWADISLSPAPTGGETPQNAGMELASSTSSTMAAAIPWTLLLVIALVATAIFLIVRYVRVTRERFFDALDEAADQAKVEGRREAQNALRATNAAPTPAQVPVA
ncbi:hypothetical protein D6T64_17355 [Cryobacterium melibiosiphilum]|uniref:DUF916 domain-containing protein n=1 Tax=Cryobacterium melibiosiphilum TaxID=995039 RepID=A0A3A5MIN6_9MICO|nr:hypothetical protein [Cryobacterium melibiosiphilum]RJT86898.1 hypothetical protein D6T64_17355 [Cryobacterium melibiosiphilum]